MPLGAQCFSQPWYVHFGIPYQRHQHQDRNGIIRQQGSGRDRRKAPTLLQVILLVISGKIDLLVVMLFLADARKLFVAREETFGIQSQDLQELPVVQALWRFCRELNDRLFQRSVTGKENVLPLPDAVSIEDWNRGKRVIPAVLVIAGMGLPLFQATVNGDGRTLQNLCELVSGKHFVLVKGRKGLLIKRHVARSHGPP